MWNAAQPPVPNIISYRNPAPIRIVLIPNTHPAFPPVNGSPNNLARCFFTHPSESSDN